MATINTKIYDGQLRAFPGNYRINKLTVNDIDITDQYIQIDIFESIFSVLSARITMIDTRNLVKNIPIIGEEIVKIDIDDGVNRMDLHFRCHAITDRMTIGHNSLRYIMHLSSEEAFADSFMRVSKSYYQKKLEDNVKDILTGPLYLQSTKDVIVGETDEAQCLVVPYWSPLHAINWMSSRARSSETQYRAGTFVFYETISGFRWVALENLYDSGANRVYGRVTYDPMRPTVDGTVSYDRRSQGDVMSFESWRIAKSFNTLENARAGMYANRATVIDLMEKTHEDKDYNYFDTFFDHTHLDGINGLNAAPLCTRDHPALGFPEAHIRVVVKHKGLFNDEPEGNSRIEEWMPGKLSQYQQLQNHVIQGELPGHIGLEAGMIVMFDMPNPQDVSVNPNPGPDTAYSGQYVVTHVRRVFQRESFKLVVEMAKDSRATEAVFAGTQSA